MKAAHSAALSLVTTAVKVVNGDAVVRAHGDVTTVMREMIDVLEARMVDVEKAMDAVGMRTTVSPDAPSIEIAGSVLMIAVNEAMTVARIVVKVPVGMTISGALVGMIVVKTGTVSAMENADEADVQSIAVGMGSVLIDHVMIAVVMVNVVIHNAVELTVINNTVVQFVPATVKNALIIV
ncbi:hypothetical protein CULCOIPH002_12430 [Corynebacterium ulcerans]|uniref:Uncharacterized protein n=1 Tax=Corynebacterium ulcerans TaxID=65058 RepID=A0ABD0BIT1_CORUL|nr:hypothetical protein CULC0102_1136 [Corynebacterium ulcerans 0102]GJJ35088.1 hypothetical protein CULCOIPH001_22960 [Corynebacterium ulcerans]GJJ36331.1 hypothetical protein CULCOIPH002_12430 [Corynebacterium ulcerans]GJJ38083.1 hypothetical protein CULCOIPH003_07140 [Corynebacterium ulcerans]GJJ41086.1 hypothetical protein CULCOIPH004_14970 [Corynebacterium ulcerans]